MSLCSIKVVSRGTARSKVGPESVIDLASDVALQAAHNFALGTSFERTPCSVGSRTCAISKAWDGDHVQSRVCGSIAVRIQTVASGLSGGRRNRIAHPPYPRCSLQATVVGLDQFFFADATWCGDDGNAVFLGDPPDPCLIRIRALLEHGRLNSVDADDAVKK